MYYMNDYVVSLFSRYKGIGFLRDIQYLKLGF